MENTKWLKIFIRGLVFKQALFSLLSGIAWAIDGNNDKWFTRWALGMILLSAYGVMKHLDHNE